MDYLKPRLNSRRLLIAVLALGLLTSGPVLAQESPTLADNAATPTVTTVEDSGRMLTNRAAAVLLAEALDLSDQTWQGLFSDVGESTEMAGTIEALALAGVAPGFQDGSFRPDEAISRGEFAIWMDRAFFLKAVEPDLAPFTDVPEDAPYADAVHSLYAEGVTVGCSAKPLQFCGESDLTVWQAETFIARALAVPYVVSDCEDPNQWWLLCDVYELIDTEYVLGVTDEELAAPISEAAMLAAEQLDESASKRSRFDCSIPDPLFEPVCAWASEDAGPSLYEVAESAVREVVKALDPNSAYHDPEEWAMIEESGRYVGIGVRVVTVNDQWQPSCSPLSDTCRIFVITAFEGGPAYNAGIQRGDFIVAVDGERLHDLTLGQAAGLIRGEVDTQVDITIERSSQEHVLTLTRQEIVVPYTSADFHNSESIAYIHLTSFSSFPGGAVEDFRERLTDAMDSELIVLDLRNNGGGSVRVLQGIAGAFLGEVPVMTFHTLESSYDVDGEGSPLVGVETPRIAILVNGNSASASEVLAGVLQETGRAVVVGETTYKKNTGQSLFDLSNEGVFRLTTIKWTTPGGIDIGDSGVPLDIETGFPNTTLQGLMEWVKSLLDNPPEETPEEAPETPEE